MSLPPLPALLADTLRTVARRYRLPPLSAVAERMHEANPATALAITIEQARLALANGEVPGAALKHLFVESLARMVREAIRPDAGDPAFQAMVLRHRVAHVREYASLAARADQDRRAVLAAVNAVAHPNKQQRIAARRLREAMASLHAAASASAWADLQDAVRTLLAMPEIANDTPDHHGLMQLLESPALQRLRRLEALLSDELVRQYRSLWDRQGPRSGTATATAQGVSSRQRGAAVEALAAQALRALAQRLNEREGSSAPYRVVTSMRVPASLPASHERAKTEWDAVLLRRAETARETADDAGDDTPAWDVCLLVEAKASADAATTDLPRLLRGLRLLAHAEPHVVYTFQTEQGAMRLRGAALRSLPTDEADLSNRILYCSDAPAETNPRMLSAASRMQLLSAPATLAFASRLIDQQHADSRELEPVWHQLIESPQWSAVLNQYRTLRQVREFMVHADDLLAAIAETGRPG
ncbi:3-deoxy-D-arabino-heptulosonate 7-phosphate synthase [Cupriavidus gilardii]|uniref:3-deoxy-D-arabino-heptulosonate 7-phosphate synthase n=1 Tax=Cupriavidus gilardii TaxID=82541 RepID=UPI0021C0EF20|nr:3-deoxy-D-arabino-heptulosonate 7-phosphate synthase [Cupriavidus gilardii]MCT9127250.1 3-deoxy-D-arabino-heptulosonate 7-phosphate synthase [Cupriavidus gilardii]